MRGGVMSKCFFPSAQSTEVIRQLWRFAIDNPHFKSESWDHDIRLTELRLKLEKLTQFRTIFPENLLQSSSELAEDEVLGDFVKVQSDAALVMNCGNDEKSVYALEMEIHSKGHKGWK